MRREFATSRLSRAIRALVDEKGSHLERRKKEALKGFRREDFIWHYLLQSFATIGKAPGWHGLIENKETVSLAYCSAVRLRNSPRPSVSLCETGISR